MHHHLPADDSARRKWQNPEAILQKIGLQPGQVFADIGCGEGFFAIPAAKIVGLKGKVYCLDADAHSINKLQETAALKGLTNIDCKAGKAEENIFCRSCVDVAFLGIVLHDFDDPARVLANIKKMLKPGGRLANLDWKKETLPLGPPLWKKFSEKKAARLVLSAGLAITEVTDCGRYHYLILAKPL
jgi:ubiquinone/menaquinone biosynthesis C-methylase UbiE